MLLLGGAAYENFEGILLSLCDEMRCFKWNLRLHKDERNENILMERSKKCSKVTQTPEPDGERSRRTKKKTENEQIVSLNSIRGFSLLLLLTLPKKSSELKLRCGRALRRFLISPHHTFAKGICFKICSTSSLSAYS
jgi:hypothetical protein